VVKKIRGRLREFVAGRTAGTSPGGGDSTMTRVEHWGGEPAAEVGGNTGFSRGLGAGLRGGRAGLPRAGGGQVSVLGGATWAQRKPQLPLVPRT